MPTTKSTITITNLQDAAGNLLANAWLTVRLNAGANGGVVDGAVIATPSKVQTDASGDASIQLYPNSAITPAASYYTITVDETSPLIYRTISVPSGGVTKDWSDATIQTTPVSPDLAFPAATTGTNGEVLTTNGTTATWEAPAASTATTVNILLGDVEVDGTETSYPVKARRVGSDDFTTTTTVNAATFAALLTTFYPSGANVVVLEGANKGVYAITGANADEPWAEVDAKLVETSAAPRWVGELTNDGWYTINTVPSPELTFEATDGGKVTGQFLRVNNNGSIDHDIGAFTTTDLGNLSSGLFAVAVVRPVSPQSNSQSSYAELLTQPHDPGDDTWDNLEWAFAWSKGRPYQFFEWTEQGDSAELEGPQGGTGFYTTGDDWTPPPGQWSCIAVSLEFNVSGQWRGRHLRQVHDDEDLTIKGLKWRIVREVIGTTGPTSIDTTATQPWSIGLGPGNTHVAYMAAYNGPSGALIFELDANDATVSTEVDDAQGNTWTAGAQAFVAQDVMPFDQTGGSVADGSITTAKLADSAVTSAKIANGTIVAGDLASDLAALIPTRIAPSSNTSVTSSTTLTDITGLSFSVTAGRTYDFDGILFASGDSAGDGKIGITFPTGTMRAGVAGLLTSASSLPGAGGTGEVIDASGESVRVGLVTGSTTPSVVSGTFVCTSSGTVQFQWAQNASSATASVLEANGSRISYTSRPT